MERGELLTQIAHLADRLTLAELLAVAEAMARMLRERMPNDDAP
jgi:hypothetical protein